MTFECIVEADLAREASIYSGSSAARAIEFAEVAAKLARLFNFEGIIKIVRYRRVGGSIKTLSKVVYKDGEVVKREEVPVKEWHNY